MKLQCVNNTPLADEDIVLWAAYPYWNMEDALLLIMGLEPLKRRPEFNIEDENACDEYFNKLHHLNGIIVTAVNNEELEGYASPVPDGRVVLKPYPLDTIEYLVSKGIDVDERLRVAVLKANNKWTPEDAVSGETTCKPTIKNKVDKRPAELVDPVLKSRMLELNKISHEPGNEAKKKIAQYVLEEMPAPCTCLSSQMKRHIIKYSKGDGSRCSLSYISNSGSTRCISEKLLSDIICNVFTDNGAKERIHRKNRVVSRCDKHGIL